MCVVSGLLCVSGCDSQSLRQDGASVTDSAGVRITVSQSPIWTADEQWRLSDSPTVVIGRSASEPSHALDRIMGAARVSDGRIMVADMGSSQVRVFDPSGSYLTSIGGAGTGPGEFTQITGLHRLLADGLAIEDRLERVHLFDADGTYQSVLRTGTMPVPIDPFSFHENPYIVDRIVGWLTDSAFIASQATEITLSTDRRFETVQTPEKVFSRFSADGSTREEILRLPGRTYHPHPMNLILPVVFGPTNHAAVSENTLVVGQSGTGQISWYTPEGQLVSIARRSWTRRTVGDTEIDEYVQRSSPPLPEDVVRGRTFADMLPVFSELLVDTDRNVWVRQYDVSHAATTAQFVRTFDTPSRWFVFDPSGRWLGVVDMPAHFSALEIGTDYVLGLTRDEFDVEFIEQFELIKPTRQ